MKLIIRILCLFIKVYLMIYLKIINGSFGNFVILYLNDFKKIVIVKKNIVSFGYWNC